MRLNFKTIIVGGACFLFDGSDVIKGLKFGFVLALISGAASAGLSGVFNLPGLNPGFRHS
ncbi:MAG: hypothetical protein V3S21_06635 [Xanthomonadales bacterium]